MSYYRLFVRCVLLLSLFCSQGVSAGDYYWQISGNATNFSSAVSACQAVQINYPYKSIIMVSTTVATCVFDGTEMGVPEYQYMQASRSGTSCPPDTTYNSATGVCDPVEPPPDPDQCAAQTGQSTSWSLLRPDTSGLGNTEYGCSDSCRISLGTSTCSATPEGATPGICYGTGTFTGAACSPGDEPTGGTPPPDPTDPPLDPSEPPPPNCGAGYSWSGTTCVPSDGGDPGDPGDTGDTGDGGDAGDGGDGGDAGDGGDGSGDAGDGDGTGDGTGDGDGDGDGTGDDEGDGDGEEPGACDPATDPNKCEKPEESSVGGEACEADLTCTGDVIQCAILKQQKELRCHIEEQGDFDKQKSAIDAAVEGDKFKLQEGGSIELPSFINKGARFLPSSCPAAENFTLSTGGGRTFALSYEPLCRAASDLSPLFLVVATVLAALYVGRAVGGQ